MITYILIKGYKRSGKDTFATLLQQQLPNSEIKAFATPLKGIISDTLNITVEQLDYAKNNGKLKSFFKFKRPLFLFINFRKLLQTFGNDVIKKHLGIHIWRDTLLNTKLKEDTKYVIVSDFRVTEEYIKDSITVLIERPSTTKDIHITEQPLDIKYTYRIYNSLDLVYLEKLACSIAKYIIKR